MGGGGFGGGGGGRGCGIDWVGLGQGVIGAYLARRRVRQQMLDALEADMTERGIPVPSRPMSQERVYALGFLSGLFLGLLIGLIFWELT
jgi:hypothetical protein